VSGLSLVESADLVGRYRHVELALFTRLGGRAPQCHDDALAVYCQSASLAHGEHLVLVEALLPNGPVLSERDWSRSPGEPLEEALVVVFAEGDDEEFIDSLVGALYPMMTYAYDRHLKETNELADGAMRRTLRRLVSDTRGLIEEARHAGVALRNGTRARRVRQLLATGGPFGALRPEDGTPGQAAGGGA
jgi:hypothetical protein